MSAPENKNPEDQGARPAAPITIADAELAANYVERELHRAKQSRDITAIVGSLLVLAALFETLYIGGKMASYLQPATAAQVASGMISSRLDDHSDEIRDNIANRLPTFINQIPDQAIAQMPQIRTKLEDTLTTNLNSYATSTSKSLNTELLNYLDSHKDEVHAALTGGKDSAGVHQLAEGLSQQFIQSLQTQSEGGETLQQKIDMTQTSMDEIKSKLDHLASNQNLTPDDKRTRHIIAIMARSINDKAPHIDVAQTLKGAQSTVATSL